MAKGLSIGETRAGKYSRYSQEHLRRLRYPALLVQVRETHLAPMSRTKIPPETA